jgi:hypothetical protein
MAENTKKVQSDALAAIDAQRQKAASQLINPNDPTLINRERLRLGLSYGDTVRGLKLEAETRQKRHAQQSAMLADMEAGTRFGIGILGDEGLGRLEGREDIERLRGQYAEQLKAAQDRAAQSVDIGEERLGDIESRLRAIADQGLSTQEAQAKRERAFQDIQRATQTQSRQAQALLSRAGVRGAVAGRQLLDIESQGAQRRSEISRDIFLESEAVRRQGLANLAQFGVQRSNLELGREAAEQRRQEFASSALTDQAGFVSQVATFDLGQAAKEKDILLQSGLGFAQIGQSERSGQAQAAAVAAQRPACFLPGQHVEMEDGSTKAIENLKVGDIVKEGGKVLVVGHGEADEIFTHGSLRITGDHAIHDGKGWVQIKHLKQPKYFIKKPVKVYNLITENHKLIVEGQLCGDWYDPKTIDGLRGLLYNTKCAILNKVRISVQRLSKRMRRLIRI